MKAILSYFDGLYFSEPVFFVFLNLLWLLGIIILLVLVLKVIYRPKKSKNSQYKILGRDGIWVLALIICALSIIALTGPKANKGVKLISGGNIDVGFIVDNSFSTKTDDIGGKSRLDIAKNIIADFVDSGALKTGDRITLFVFGTNSVWRMPFSEDFNIFRSQLDELSHPQVYDEDSQLNTNLANAIEHVPKAVDKQDNFFKKKSGSLGTSWIKNNIIMFLFSDGDDNEDATLSRGIRELNKRNIKIYSVGIGTKEGKKITIEAYDPNDSNKTTKITIKTGLKTQRLSEIALKTGGELYLVDSRAGITGAQSFLKNAVNKNRTLTPRLVASNESRDIWWEILALPSVILMLLLIKVT